MRKGFTLIELLVVIAIIAILAAILFPVFAKAREKARQTSCLNNQRQIATATLMYAQDHDEQLPEATAFWGAINLDKGVLKCPTASRLPNGYVFNNLVAGKALGESPLSSPETAMITADGAHAATRQDAVYYATYDNVAYEAVDLASRHSGKFMVAFADGHTELTGTPPGLSGKPQVPAIIPMAGLELWLKADAGVTTSGTNVSTWTDQSTAHNDATLAAGSTVTAATNNGKQYIDFTAQCNPVTGGFYPTNYLQFTTRMTDMRTIFFVFYDNLPAGIDYHSVILGDDTLYDFCTGSFWACGSFFSGTWANPGILNGTVRVNGQSVTPSATPFNRTPTVYTILSTANLTASNIGHDRSYASSLYGRLAELIIYKTPQNSAQVTQIEQYLGQKYGITVQ